MISMNLYEDHFSAKDMRNIWSESETIRLWLWVEQRLAAHQADLGVIDPQVAACLATVSADSIDRQQLSADMQRVGRPILGLLNQLRTLLPTHLQAQVHFGTTTQDIMDTAANVQISHSISWIETTIERIVDQLLVLERQHAQQDVIARTNGQYAMPMRLSQKFQVWRYELLRRKDSITQLRSTALCLQLSGPVGDQQSLGTCATELRRRMANDLGLLVLDPHWQNARDGLTELIGSVGLLAGSLTKISHNVNLLSSSDIGEFHERQLAGEGSSSSMKHKRNQRCSEFAEATARLARQCAEQMGEFCNHEHERNGGMWIGEWYIVPKVFLLTSAALQWVEKMLSNIEIDREAINSNISKHQERLRV
ncbi:lyase family protein [Pseudoteredinibacter isoporae]|uniref:lyase family protein n=1 Tax=Pseudoteredinibacter isoporae TaxID=570281 RepID=UPI00310BA6C6